MQKNPKNKFMESTQEARRSSSEEQNRGRDFGGVWKCTLQINNILGSKRINLEV